MVYLGVLLDSISFRASPAQKRGEKLLSIGDVFLSCEEQPVSSWLELLGVLSSMIQLIPGGTASDAVSSISLPALLGSCRPDDPYPLDSRDPSGSGVVAESHSLGTRYFAHSGVPSARLVARRLGRGLGGSFRGRGHFRPLVS